MSSICWGEFSNWRIIFCMYKVWIYFRKSTDQDDYQALSISKQRDIVDWLLKRIGEYEIIKTWEESITGTKSWVRPGFSEMLKMVKDGKIDCLVVWQISRLARNAIDQAYIEHYLFEAKKLKMIISEEWQFRPEDDVHMLRIHFSNSSQYSRNLSKYARQGMLTKVKTGQPVRVSRWYEFDKHKKAVPSQDAPIIRKIFALKREGVSMKDIWILVFNEFWFWKNWKPLPAARINEILKNPIYYWAIKYLWELYDWNFEALVSKKEWEIANSTNTSSRWETKVDELDFVRWFIKNSETGHFLSPYRQKWNIYFCSTERWEGKTLNYSLNAILEYFSKHIHEYELPEELKPYFVEWIREFYHEKNKENTENRDSIMREIKMTEKKLTNLLEMRLNWEIGASEYQSTKESILLRKTNLDKSLKKYQELDAKFLENIEKCFELAVSLSGRYFSASIIEKVSIIKMVCFELFLTHEKALQIEENSLFKGLRLLGNTIWLG